MSNTLTSVQGLLLDLDGVLYVGDRVIEGAVEAIHRLKAKGIPLRFLTNTTTRSLASLHAKLVGLGLPIEAFECFGVIKAAQIYLRSLDKPRCFFLLTEGPMEDFTEFEQDDSNPDIVLVGDVGKVWDYSLMQRMFEMIMNGAQLVTLHKGKYWQTESGLQMDIGAFVAGLEYVTSTTATVLGKPSRQMFELALDDMGLRASEVAMVGDDLDNDIGGAQAWGMKAVLVRTGKFRQEVLEKSSIKPDMVVDSVGSLFE